jgi:hypothetical protein
MENFLNWTRRFNESTNEIEERVFEFMDEYLAYLVRLTLQLSPQDFFESEENEENKEYEELRKKTIKAFYNDLKPLSHKNHNYSTDNSARPYQDTRGLLWVPFKLKDNEGNNQDAWLQLFKNGEEIKVYDKEMLKEVFPNQSKLKLTSLSDFVKKAQKYKDSYMNKILVSVSCINLGYGTFLQLFPPLTWQEKFIHFICAGLTMTIAFGRKMLIECKEPNQISQVLNNERIKEIIREAENSQIQPNPEETKTNQQKLPNPKLRLRLPCHEPSQSS